MPYGTLQNFGQAPLSPPVHSGGSLITHMNSGSQNIPVPGSNGSNSSGNALQTSQNTVYRSQYEDKRLTRDAMEKYLRDRNDMIIVILHAKVRLIGIYRIIFIFWEQF